jgi:predicted CXXCH cytochrome family protein
MFYNEKVDTKHVIRVNGRKGWASLLAVGAAGIFSLFFLSATPMDAVPQVGSQPHPVLPDVKNAKCVNCHDDLAGKKVMHAPLADGSCDTCHEMKKTEDETLVSLVGSGNDLCLACHSGIEEALGRKNVHAAMEEGCSACHDPHSSDFEKLLVSDYKELCASCHDIEADEFSETHGRQPVDETGCGTCHETHGSDEAKLLAGEIKHAPFESGDCTACHRRPRGRIIRLRADGASLCYACHSDKEEEFARSSVHTPLKRGDCVACHDPHLGDFKSMLKARGNGLCLGCHENIRALLQAENIHPPAEEDCLSCHDAHASDHAFDLLESPVDSCLACHDGGDEAFQSRHYQLDAQELDCVECHNPHGSENPTLLNTYTHIPFGEGECETCHTGGEGGKGAGLVEEEVDQLCFVCHDDKTEDANQGLVRHAALDMASCTACHSPHASSREHILLDHTSRLCTSCHDDVLSVPQGEAHIHQVIESRGCQACHDSHYSEDAMLLFERPNRLCLACHLEDQNTAAAGNLKPMRDKLGLSEEELASYKKVILNDDLTRGHPDVGHVVTGQYPAGSRKTSGRVSRALVFEGELTCLSCHDSHAGASAGIFSDGLTTRFEVCLKCHKK